MKLYTKTGDKGTTSLYDGHRLDKDEIFFEVLGESDELSARIGCLCAHVVRETTGILRIYKRDACGTTLRILRRIQSDLQDINSIIATVEAKGKKLPEFGPDKTEVLERHIDILESENTQLTKFILPGVGIADAQAQLCRTQARRFERALWHLEHAEWGINTNRGPLSLDGIRINSNILTYVNRLSDYFFTLARWMTKTLEGLSDILA